MSQWQDISTAPKDGTYFLAHGAFMPRGGFAVIRYGGENGTAGAWGEYIWATPDSGVSTWAELVPTHWMPLPPAPAGAA